MYCKPTRRALWERTSLTVFVLILSANLAYASSTKLSKDLQELSGSNQIDVIVQFNHVPTAEYHQKVLSRGGVLKQNLGQFKGAAYMVPA
jgi:hypothetical protein